MSSGTRFLRKCYQMGLLHPMITDCSSPFHDSYLTKAIATNLHSVVNSEDYRQKRQPEARLKGKVIITM